MPVTITTTNTAASITGSPQKYIARGPGNVLWTAQHEGGRTRFWYSADDGTTWDYSGSSSDLVTSVYFPISLFVDADGYMHVVQTMTATTLRYWRGTAYDLGTKWQWRSIDISSTQGLLEWDTDVVAYRTSSGSWKVHFTYIATTVDGSGNPVRKCCYGRHNVSSSGGLSNDVKDVLVPGFSTTGELRNVTASIEFQHTGDGMTPTSTPHIYVVGTTLGVASLPRLWKYRYESGSWSWDTVVNLDTVSITNGNSSSRAIWDGSRIMLFSSTGSTSTPRVKLYEWTESSGVKVVRTAPDLGSIGLVKNASLAHDPDSDDLWVAVYGSTVGDIKWIQFSRGFGIFIGAWETVETQASPFHDGNANLIAHVKRSTVDLVYEKGANPPYTVKHHRLATINHLPTAPVLTRPSPAAVVDAAAGYRFEWRFTDPDPGDSQNAWAMRRRVENTSSYQYLNASGDWVTISLANWDNGDTVPEMWHSGAAATYTFPSGKWVNGTNYMWTMRTKDALGEKSPSAGESLVVVSAAPIADITAPSGTIFDTIRPIVRWTFTPGSGTVGQRTWRVKIFNLAQYSASGFNPATSSASQTRWDSGVVAGATARQVKVETDLTNLGTYRAYIQVTDVNSATSAWAYEGFTLALTPSAPPLLEALTERFYGTGVERVRLTLEGRTNLLSANQASMETDASGWENDQNCTLSIDSSSTASGNLSLLMTPTGSFPVLMKARTAPGLPPPVRVDEPPLTGPLEFPVYGGMTYTAMGSVQSAGATRLTRMSIRWYDASDTLLSTSQGANTASSSAWQTRSVTAVAPAGPGALVAVRARVVLEVTDAGVNDVHRWDALSFAPGTSTAWHPGGLKAAQTYRVVRTVDGVDEPVRTAASVLPDMHERAIVYDREMPYGVNVVYRGYADAHPTPEAALTSAATAEVLALVESDTWGLRDPFDDDAEMRALVIGYSVAPVEEVEVYRPPGRVGPIVESEGVLGSEGKVTIYSQNLPERQQLANYLNRSGPMLLQSPIGERRYVRFIDRSSDPSDVSGQTHQAGYVDVPPP